MKFSLVNDAAISEEYLAPKSLRITVGKYVNSTPRLSAYPLKPSSSELFVYYGWDYFFRNGIIFFINVSYSK